MNKILLTGSSGFVGQRFVEYNSTKYILEKVSLQKVRVNNINFENVFSIVHLAGKAHQMEGIDSQVYFDVNYLLTKELADAAKVAKVPHFVFMSTIKAYGEVEGRIINLQSSSKPFNDPYGESKLKAEKYLESIENEKFKVAIIRTPLVYGPRVKGNLIRLLELSDRNWPLPFGEINNRRTMVYVDNLIELVNKIIDKRAQGLFLAGDRSPVSTTKLISEIRKNLSQKSNLFELPKIFRQVFSMVKPELSKRLFGSLEIDTKFTFKKLDFIPPFSIEEGISEMTQWYKDK